jgi:tetratricopeptide (TPR) repeat protein
MSQEYDPFEGMMDDDEDEESTSREEEISPREESSTPTVADKPKQPDNYEKSDEFKEMLNEFHEGIEKKLEGTDEGPEAFYNLGVSYYEMGLMDQAMDQLEKSCKAPEWKLSSLSMIGAIHRNQGEYDKAVKTFTICYQSTTDAFAKLGFRYEIADTMAVQGKFVEAYKMFATVYKADKGYRDTRNRLLEIKATLESKNKT